MEERLIIVVNEPINGNVFDPENQMISAKRDWRQKEEKEKRKWPTEKKKKIFLAEERKHFEKFNEERVKE